ncbi:phosphomethylpyrimidine kinase [Corynebacterium ulcerans]|nr:phosphomethylpyrimidine kinase [Corynebacterium ulcerans]
MPSTTSRTAGRHSSRSSQKVADSGGYGMCVITALVAQNTQGVRNVHTPPTDFLRSQLNAVSDDVAIDAIKIGMLGDSGVIATVSQWLASLPQNRDMPIVLDPVMISTSGHRLLDPQAEKALQELALHATVVTPNLPELAVLCGTPLRTNLEKAITDAQNWSCKHGVTVIVKGGHLHQNHADNAVVFPSGSFHRVPNTRIKTTNTHGTGCSLSSALATRLGLGEDLVTALDWSTAWLHEAIAHGSALQVGHGHGPIDHGYRARKHGACA